jgi:hypothetical protein
MPQPAPPPAAEEEMRPMQEEKMPAPTTPAEMDQTTKKLPE